MLDYWNFIARKFTLRFRDILGLSLLLLIFRTTIGWIIRTFLNQAFYEYGIVFLILLGLLVGKIFRQKDFFNSLKFTPRMVPMVGLVVFLLLDLVNTVFFHYYIVSAVAFFFCLYCFSGFYLEPFVWKKNVAVVIFFSLTLPFLDHLQTFLGFPLRILTAKVVSMILHFMHFQPLSDSTIIVIENNATSIDLPCSGVKSIYVGIFFVFLVLYLKKIPLQAKTIFVSLVFFFLLIFFNIWRVFSLVFIADILHMPQFGDTVHVGLGIFGFAVSCFLFLYGVKRYGENPSTSASPLETSSKSGIDDFLSHRSPRFHKILLLLIFCFFLVGEIYTFSAGTISFSGKPQTGQKNFAFALPHYQLKEIPFSTKEKNFFEKREIKFSRKFEGKTPGGIVFSLLLVSSSSWDTHHNPEVCLQGIGYQIGRSAIVQLDGLNLRNVFLNDGKFQVFYWFQSGQQTTADYSQRVFEGIFHPSQVWTLKEIGFDGSADLRQKDIQELIKAVQNTSLSF